MDRIDEAKPYFDAAVDLSNDPGLSLRIAATGGTETGDYADAIAALRNPQFEFPEETRGALLAGYAALASGDPQAKMKAIDALRALPKDSQQDDRVATMLAALGATREALAMASQKPRLFWRRSMRGVLNEPGFPAVAKQLRLMAYWKATHTKPDVCRNNNPPPFCRMI
jgi:hypothetical protein